MRQIKVLVCLLVGGVVSSTEQLQFIRNFLEAVHKDRSISTILLMQSKDHKNDFLHGLYPIPWPIIRLDETKKMKLVNYFNKDFLALVYMESNEDALLLSALAANFNHIRETRIMIWLQMSPSEVFIENIAFEAANHKFLNLVVIENTLRTRRFYPFPQPMVQVIENLFEEKEIYPAHWRNFMGKKAYTIPDMVPPRSFYSFDPKTGLKREAGSIYKVIKVFTQRYNITMRLKWPPNINTTQEEIIERTVRGEIDLPLTGQLINFRHPNGSRTQPLLGMTTLSITVPCGPELPMFDRFFLVFGLATPITIAGYYVLLSIIDVLLGTLSDRVKRHLRREKFLNLVVNLRVFGCILSLSTPQGNRLRSVKGQLTMVMSFTGLILSCIVAAQTSTILTMKPQYRHINNFQELRDSNITVICNQLNYKTIKQQMNPQFVSNFLPNIRIVTSIQQMKMIVDLNTSYAYQTFSYKKDPFTVLQIHTTRRALCRSPDLDLVSGLAYTAVLEKNSIYALPLQHYTLQVFSAGLVFHWGDEAIRDLISTLKHTQLEKLPIVIGYQALKLQDYKICWMILFIGGAVAFCVFIGEVVAGCINRGILKI
ncbi:uncharacterized protein LOC6542168 [Drosophila erecta]|uniref:Ionotropic glutamate receptor C-terminal domain-containing protein n=1 Tax=Drosophila erecta TaxID=7220 RepID=B3N6E9_DROER|nr:uncharacterized protein LOC6542168 [Drosophila erecta]EDV58118.2 uncharacterized protein Dere_GG25214 [Drosophila erecta]